MANKKAATLERVRKRAPAVVTNQGFASAETDVDAEYCGQYPSPTPTAPLVAPNDELVAPDGGVVTTELPYAGQRNAAQGTTAGEGAGDDDDDEEDFALVKFASMTVNEPKPKKAPPLPGSNKRRPAPVSDPAYDMPDVPTASTPPTQTSTCTAPFGRHYILSHSFHVVPLAL